MTDHFAEYDPDRANALLDEIGLDQRDSDGFRLGPDGETLFINMQVAVPEEAWGKSPNWSFPIGTPSASNRSSS